MGIFTYFTLPLSTHKEKIMKKYRWILLLFAAISFTMQGQLLWRIEGKSLKSPSYIFGTYHVASISIVDSIASLKKAVVETSQVYGEIDMEHANKFAIENATKMMLGSDSTISSLLGEKKARLVNEFIKPIFGSDLSSPAFNKLKPGILAAQIGVAVAASLTPGFNPNLQLDAYFQQIAKSAGKPCHGFETTDYQLNLLTGNSIDRQLEELMCTIEHSEEQEQSVRDIIQAYMGRNLTEIESIMNRRSNDSCDPNPETTNALIDERNRTWVEQMPKIMDESPTLFVVGVGHLPGLNGVIALLRHKGYSLTPLN